MGLHFDDQRPRNKTYTMGMAVLMICILATSLGVTAIVLGAQANVCLTPYSYAKWRTNTDSKEAMKYTSMTQDADNIQTKTMGWYSAPTSVRGTETTWIEENPMNCITECQMNCTAAYAEQGVLLWPKSKGGCSDCLRYCTHPWGKNIEECHLSPNCTEASDRHQGIVNFCQPVAMCFQMCAGRGYKKIDDRAGATLVKAGPLQWNKDAKDPPSKDPMPSWTTAGYENTEDVAWWGPTSKNKKLRCIRECEYDGKLTVGFGLAALLLVWLAPLIILGGSMGELKSIPALVLALLFWTASLILGTDALLTNMTRSRGLGWEMLYFENAPIEYQIVVPATTGNTDGRGLIKVTFNWMMHVIFGFGLMANLFTLLAFYDKDEIWNRRPPPRPVEPPPPSPPRDEKVKPVAMSYYGEDRAKQDEMMTGGAAALAGTGENQFDVDLGVRWERHQQANVQEIVIKEVIEGGPADQACKLGANGKHVLAPGDVVLMVGNIPQGASEPEMHNVYGKPYSEWVNVVREQPAGTTIRFMFARHSEFMKYQFDIVRMPVGANNVSGDRFGNAADQDFRFEIEEEADAGVSMAGMQRRAV